MLDLSPEQLGKLLHKSRREARRGQKRYLKDLGGAGSAEELDIMLARAAANPEAVAEADRLERQRHLMARTISQGVDGRVAEMLADVRLRMEDLGLRQEEVAERCGWKTPQLNAYLTGAKSPGIANLAKIAEAVDCVWRLTSISEK